MGFLFSPHHCVGFLFFRLDPAGGFPHPLPPLTHSLTHLFTTPLITSHSSFTTLHYTIYIYLSPLTRHSPLFTTLYWPPLTHHSPLFSTSLNTSHSSFTTLHYTTHFISLIIHHSSLHHLSRGRQAQYTEPPHFPFAWQAQYIELCRGAAAQWPPLARGCLLPGRRSTQSF